MNIAKPALALACMACVSAAVIFSRQDESTVEVAADGSAQGAVATPDAKPQNPLAGLTPALPLTQDGRVVEGARYVPPANVELPGEYASSFEELLEEARNMVESEREARLAELDRIFDEELWIERANADDLSEDERLTMRAMLRERNAVAVARAEALLASLEND